MDFKCPGQDMRYLKPEDVREHPCPKCGRRVEFFKTDRSRKCPTCGARFRNPGLDLGCARWCPYAAECVDFEFDPEDRDAERAGRSADEGTAGEMGDGRQ